MALPPELSEYEAAYLVELRARERWSAATGLRAAIEGTFERAKETERELFHELRDSQQAVEQARTRMNLAIEDRRADAAEAKGPALPEVPF